MGRRTPLTRELLTYDVDVSWWVTPDAYERGYYAKLYAALRHWIEGAFPFAKAYYSNAEIPRLPPRSPGYRPIGRLRRALAGSAQTRQAASKVMMRRGNVRAHPEKPHMENRAWPLR